jgi:hypothetical protein
MTRAPRCSSFAARIAYPPECVDGYASTAAKKGPPPHGQAISPAARSARAEVERVIWVLASTFPVRAMPVTTSFQKGPGKRMSYGVDDSLRKTLAACIALDNWLM